MALPPRMSLLRWSATLTIAAAGGWAATRIGAPLPWLLGALAATGVSAAAGLRPFGAAIVLPDIARMAFIPVIGVLIGGAFTPQTLAQIPGWWPALLTVLLFTPAAHAVNYLIFRRAGALSRSTAFFAGMPGGLIESVELGAERGADVAMVTVLQFARIALVVTAVPLLFSLAQGEAVGSAAGVTISGGGPLSLREASFLALIGAAGFFGARALRMPAGQILGPVVLSAAAHGAGLTDAAPPGWLVAVAQVVIGAGLGQRFSGVSGRMLARCFGLSALSVAAMLLLGAALGTVVEAIGTAPVEIMLLALAPGGVVEMGLIALSLSASPIFVTAHHMVRIIWTVAFALGAWRVLSARRERGSGS